MNIEHDQHLEMVRTDRRSDRSPWELRALETAEEMRAVEELSRLVWPGSDLDVVPTHLLLTVAHNGGLVAGAFTGETLVGFVFGFAGLQATPQGFRPKHCSHQLAVHPDHRNSGLGFALKRFQWQFVKARGLERVTWTYDPLLSRNAHLNIAKLGAVCDTYLRNAYGELRDEVNAGLPSDRFQVDWWVNSRRVVERMEGVQQSTCDLDVYLLAGAVLINPPEPNGAPSPPTEWLLPARDAGDVDRPRSFLLEIPPDFLSLKATDLDRALVWRLSTRGCFESLFDRGFAVTDFIYRPGLPARAAYVLSRPTSEEEA
jgi:predicted GNAT superfamily acetyltransferase